MVPIIDTLPSTQTHSAKEDGEIPFPKNTTGGLLLDASRSGSGLKANQPKKFPYLK